MGEVPKKKGNLEGLREKRNEGRSGEEKPHPVSKGQLFFKGSETLEKKEDLFCSEDCLYKKRKKACRTKKGRAFAAVKISI